MFSGAIFVITVIASVVRNVRRVSRASDSTHEAARGFRGLERGFAQHGAVKLANLVEETRKSAVVLGGTQDRL